ncbi:hypothetical protein JKF63_03976 [Porcisia hertigi]|uniref:Uncharacterized protein n=1 Tax=Porcisia hertigi TaxID=2761500 RepID=A0A836IL39_9TRYP|nr:hypothetical protein JKF63_03976 [Porcisia hertigi]
MGLFLCQPKPTSVVNSKTTRQPERSEARLAPLQRSGTVTCFASGTPPLVEMHQGVGGTSPPSPTTASGLNERDVCVSPSSSSSDSVCVDDDCPECFPGTLVSAGGRELAHRGASHERSATVPESVLTSSLRGESDLVSFRRSGSLAASSTNANFSPNGICAGFLSSVGDTDASIPANGGIRQIGSIGGTVDAGQLSSILRWSSVKTDTNSPLVPNIPLSRGQPIPLQSFSTAVALMPRRGSVRFLGSDANSAEPPEVRSPQSSSYGNQNRPGKTLPNGKTLASTPVAQSDHQRAQGSLISVHVGADIKSPNAKHSPKFCGPLPTVLLSVSRGTPSPFPSVEDPPLGSSNHSGVFKGLTFFNGNDNIDKSGVFYDHGDSLSQLPASAATAAASNASQSPKSILLRPSMNTSGAGGLSVPQNVLCPPLPPDFLSPGSRRLSRRRQSEQGGVFSEKRPSFTSDLTMNTSDSRQHRLSRGEESSGDDEHLVASVRAAMVRLHRTDEASSVCGNTSVRPENGLSSSDRHTRALDAAKRMSATLLSLPNEMSTRAESRQSISKPANSECDAVVAPSGAEQPAVYTKSLTTGP